MHRGNTAFKIRLKNAYSRYKNIFNYLYISLLLLQKYRNIYVKKEIIEFFGISNIFLPCNKTRHNQLKKGQRIKKTNFVACWSRGRKKKKKRRQNKNLLSCSAFLGLGRTCKVFDLFPLRLFPVTWPVLLLKVPPLFFVSPKNDKF